MLDRLDQTIPWQKLAAPLTSMYRNQETGRPNIPVVIDLCLWSCSLLEVRLWRLRFVQEGGGKKILTFFLGMIAMHMHRAPKMFPTDLVNRKV